jgi:mannitol/fructose-specific phosphotransferase system IIA component (Ntr-type)
MLVSKEMSTDTGRSSEHFYRGFLEGTQVGATPVMGSVALPHLRLAGLKRSHLVLVRSAEGVDITIGAGVPESSSPQSVRALFFMASPEDDPAQHLRLLANLAGAVEQDGFMERWNAAVGPAELKEALLRSEHSLTLAIEPGTLRGTWIGRSIASLALPDELLVALVYRDGERIIPTGRTVFEAGDRVIVIGEPQHISQLRSDLGLDSVDKT